MAEKADVYKVNMDDPDLLMLERAAEATRQACDTAPTSANLRDYQAAKKALDAYRAGKAEDPPLKNPIAVHEYLVANGWKVSQAKVYKDDRYFKRQGDGSITRKEADKYASMFLKKLDGSDAELDASEKLKWETEIAKQKAELLQRKNDVEAGMYVLRADVEAGLAARVRLLKSDMRNLIRFAITHAYDKAKEGVGLPEVIERGYGELEQVMNRYGRPIKFHVPVVDAGDKGEE